MSRFKRLRKHLSFGEAFRLYRKVKTGNLQDLRISRLQFPFSMRNNPYDYATFEEVVLEETYDLDKSFKPEYIIDGGGNIGLTAAYFATKYPEAKIVSVEPDIENFELLQKNISAYKNVKGMNCGIWGKDAHLLVKDNGLGNNGFTVEETQPGTPGSIPALSIQSIIQKMQWPRIDLLKLDVEGSEKNIFSAGYEQWLPKTKVLIIELHDRMQKGSSKTVFSSLSKYNFSLEIAGENLVFTNEDPVIS